MKLVIVESPAKSRTIGKILGKDYQISPSMGHIIDLPKNKMGIDIENGFEPEYVVIKERRKYLARLKREARKAESIYLAPDPDREGEAISWHLKNELGGKKKVYRVSFNEITETAVKSAFQNPGNIDMKLVRAQQARRILDRIVGYSLSPLLWRKVTRGLSAGRVQSVAVRLVVEREKEIRAFKPEEYWKIEALLMKREEERRSFGANLEKIKDKKPEIRNEGEAKRIVSDIKKNKFIVSEVKEQKKTRFPYPPFTTSKLQQDAFNKLGFSVSRTMRIAQRLYEGIELGRGESIGLITYMRTDSVRVSADAQAAAKNYILERFGKRYYPHVPNIYRSKKSAQEAHECIRPTLPLREPERIQRFLKAEEFKLYQLIWNRFIASQMPASQLLVTTVDIKAGIYLFRASGTTVVFDGFSALYVFEVSGKEDERRKAAWRIPALSVGEELNLISLKSSQHFTKPPSHYSDASLVKALEEKGIGRPSTYAPIISTIILRNYVKRMRGYLYPTELGEVVTELLVEHFPRILDTKFTAMMEDELDGIEEGKIKWRVVVEDFYKPFSKTLEEAKTKMKSVKREGVKTDKICKLCGRYMIIKWGRRGKFLSCSDFPKCKYSESITTGIKCPQPDCNGMLIERRSRRGPFYGCTNYPKCKFTSRNLPKEQDKVEGTRQVEGAG